MIFHVVAIREISEKKYTMVDILFFWVTEEEIKTILHEYNLITLELYSCDKEKAKEFWRIGVLINYKWKEIQLLSNATDLEWLAYGLSIVWFNIEYINFIDERKVSQMTVAKVITTARRDAQKWITQQEAIKQAQEKHDEQAYNDVKLEKILVLVDGLLKKIPPFLKKASNVLPKDKLKLLSDQQQELTKLKMWRNLEMLSSLLSKTYNNYNELEQEYFSKQNNVETNLWWSESSSAFVTSEIQKLEKAKNMIKIWWKTEWSDMLYASFWSLLVYFKLIKRDFKIQFKEFCHDSSEFFEYLALWFIMLLIMSSCYFAFSDIIKIKDMNEYVYVMFINFGVFWFVLHLLNRVRKKGIMSSIMIVLCWMIISILCLWVLKQTFIF